MLSIPKDVRLQKVTYDFIQSEQKMWIGGEQVSAQSGQTFPTLNPATGEKLADIPLADQADVDAAVQASRQAFEGPWTSKINPAKRSRLIWKLADLMQRDLQVFMELETLDNGKPLDKAKYDILGAINHFRYYAGWATKIEGSTIPVNATSLTYVRREPLGVVGLIVPWNFPLMMAA